MGKKRKLSAKQRGRYRSENNVHVKIRSIYRKHGLEQLKKPKNNLAWFDRYATIKLKTCNEVIVYDETKLYFEILHQELKGYKTPHKESMQRKKVADKFYASWEWTQLRYEAFQLYGRQCLCCGFRPTPGSDNYLCVDHIKPMSKFPELALDVNNVQPLCHDCNKGKSNIYDHDFRPQRDTRHDN